MVLYCATCHWSNVVECMLRLDPGKAALNVDIQNMFNSLCRVAMLEDVLDSPDSLGVDFTPMLRYLEMAYGEPSGLWFKMDAGVGGGGGLASWRRLQSRAGVHQGRPLSCFLAALGLMRCLRAAQAAIDEFNGLERFPESVSDEETGFWRSLGWRMASCA